MDLEAIESAISDEDRARLINLRGGCTCFLSPPCSACCEPLTEDEAGRLGLAAPEPATDYMKAVRDLCKGVT